MTVYASPTSEGVATVACLAPPADAGAFKGECEAVANTLQLTSGEPFPVGPDPGFAETLSATFGKLDDQVAKGRKEIDRDNTTFRGQAAAARDIRLPRGGGEAPGTQTSPADVLINRLLVERLQAASAAWKRTANAAGDKDKAAYNRSEAAIKRTQDQLAQTVKGLEAAGYSVGG